MIFIALLSICVSSPCFFSFCFVSVFVHSLPCLSWMFLSVVQCFISYSWHTRVSFLPKHSCHACVFFYLKHSFHTCVFSPETFLSHSYVFVPETFMSNTCVLPLKHSRHIYVSLPLKHSCHTWVFLHPKRTLYEMNSFIHITEWSGTFGETPSVSERGRCKTTCQFHFASFACTVKAIKSYSEKEDTSICRVWLAGIDNIIFMEFQPLF